MPGVFVGSTEITTVGKLKVGVTDVQEVYVGSTKVFPPDAPTADFVSQWQTDNAGTSANDQVTLPLVSTGNYNFDVDWGDGSPVDTITAFNDPAVTHTFIGGPGTFTVTISAATGNIDGWTFNNGGDNQKLLQISNWGPLGLGAGTFQQFRGCVNLDITATDVLDTSTADSLSSFLDGCSSVTSLVMTGWDTSNITNLSFFVLNCSSLTSLIVGGIDISNVTNMNSAFRGLSSLTSLDLSGLSATVVTNFSAVFQEDTNLATINLTGFTAPALTNMDSAFNNCAAVTLLDLSGFNTTLVTNMNSLFRSCGQLVTCDVSGFNTGNVSNMFFLFFNCGNLAVIDVSGWDTSSVSNMNGTFRNCNSVTVLDVSGWDTALVTNMDSLFADTAITTVAVDAAGWDINQVAVMTNFCDGVTLGTANYDSILAAWAAQTPLQSSVTCSFGSSQYTIATAQTDRDVLTDPPNSWNLTDGGGI